MLELLKCQNYELNGSMGKAGLSAATIAPVHKAMAPNGKPTAIMVASAN